MREHPALIEHDEHRSLSERIVDWPVAKVGTLAFLAAQTWFIILWIVARDGFGVPIDNAGLTILNLGLSFEAATLAVLILIAGNRQSAKDRAMASHTFTLVNEVHDVVVKS